VIPYLKTHLGLIFGWLAKLILYCGAVVQDRMAAFVTTEHGDVQRRLCGHSEGTLLSAGINLGEKPTVIPNWSLNLKWSNLRKPCVREPL
jgi:hypothetical protein